MRGRDDDLDYGATVDTAVAATWPTQDLLPALRRSLAEADEALLCVAFVNVKGINLVAPQLSRLASHCRMIVTSAFGGDTTTAALALAADLRVHVRVLNIPGGTFHPKLYLARHRHSAVAVIGSANLTAGLVTNVEAAVIVAGRTSDLPITQAWELGERLWDHPASTDWIQSTEPVTEESFDPKLLQALRHAIPDGSIVHTLADGWRNAVNNMRSCAFSSGPGSF